ncbi:MAG: 1,4-dihydroxy-2-naphthoate polyprenyltransferase [Anaerolineales bacterium]|jgi:1,4-dihydroxy-2-naphthoate octaprenyltransferase
MTDQSQPPISKLRAWMQASRPKTLTAAVTPVLVGTAIALANESFRPLAAVAALYCAFAIQIGTNIFNDVMDFERGTDTQERMGPLRVTQAGWLPPAEVRRGAYIVFLSAALVGLYLIALGGWPVLLLGLASIMAGLAYTAGPSPLAYNGFGDLFVMLFFGFVAVGGTVYVQMQSLPMEAWFAAGAVGSTITALLGVNNIRDMETDRQAGRRTIPVLIGRQGALVEFGLLLSLAFILPTVAVIGGWAPFGVLLAWLATPVAMQVFRKLASTEGRALNKVLAMMARFVLLHGLLLAAGFLSALF